MQEFQINWNQLFVEYSKPHWNSLLRFCTTLSKDTIAAEDLLQTSLLKAMVSFSKFIGQYGESLEDADVHQFLNQDNVAYHFKNWLFKIIKNTYLDQREASKKWNFEEKSTVLDEIPSDLGEKNHIASVKESRTETLHEEEQAFYRQALDDHWKSRFAMLNQKQKSILFLISEGYSYKEIAHILDVPQGTVMSSLSRALIKLKSKDK